MSDDNNDDILRYNRIVTLLHEFNIRMTDMLPSSQDFRWVVEIVYKIFPQAHTVSLQLWRESSTLLTEWVDRQQSIENPVVFSDGQGIAGYAAAHKEVVNVPDIYVDSRYIKGHFEPSYRSLLVAPLLTSTDVLGTLSITAVNIGDFDEQDERFIDMFARQIAVLIHRFQIYTQEQEQRIFAEALRDIVMASYQSSLTTMNWEAIFQHIHNVIPYTSANIILIEIFEQEEFIYTDGYLERGIDLHALLKKYPFRDFPTVQYMLKTKLPCRIDDTQVDSNWTMGENQPNWIRSYLGVPLLGQKNVIGFISLDNEEPHFFTKIHEERLITFAATISQTLEQYQLLQNERNERRLTNALSDALSALTNPLQLDDILAHILIVLSEVIENSASEIVFLSEDHTQIYAACSRGYIERGYADPMTSHAISITDFHTYQQMLKTRKSLIVPDTEQAEFWKQGIYPGDNWVKSYIGAPIIINDKVIGFFNVDSAHKNWFTQRHADILQSFANQAGLAIQRAQLYEAEHEQRVFAKKLSEIITSLTNSSNLNELFEHTLKSISDVITNDGATITLFKDEDTVYFAGVSGNVLDTNPQLKEQLMHWEELSTWREMMNTQEPLVIGDTEQSELWEDYFNVKWIRSYVGSPIINENQAVIGFINLDSRLADQFDEHDAERLKIFADHLATVIQKTSLLEAERKQREIADTLREIGLVVAKSLSPDVILTTILEELKRVIEYTTAGIWFRSEYGDWTEQIGHDYDGTEIEHHPQYSPQIDLQAIFQQAEDSLEVILLSENPIFKHKVEELPVLKSVAVAPIIVREKVTGTLVLWHIKPDFYEAYHKPILRTLASQLAIAIDNARLYAKQEAAHKEIRFYANTLEQLVQERTAALDKERIKLSTILQEIGEGVMVIERDNNDKPLVRFANHMFCQMIGASFEEIHNQDLRYIAENFVPSITYSQLLTNFGLSSQPTTKTQMSDLIIKRRDGSSFDAQVSFTLANLEHEETWLGILLVRNVSQERNLQRQRERFLANASHELRTPLTNLNTRFYLMRHQPEKLEAHLDIVERTTQKMTILVNDLLSLMRANQRSDASTLLRCDVRTTLKEVYEIQLAEAELKNIRFTLEMSEKPLYMLTQPKHLDQIFTNVVSNAILYTPQGGEIKISCRPAGHDALVSIADTGIGIAPEFRESIFEPFTRINVDELGTGLGLAIVKEIIDIYDGEIWVESEVGQGTTFHIQLPTLDHLANIAQQT